MKTTFAIAVTLAAALAATGCSKTEEPAGPFAQSTVTTPIAPPATKAPEVPLPPLPSDIRANPEPDKDTAKDTAANAPKGDLTPAEEDKAMPKAAHGNNHSSPSLDKDPSQAQ